MISPVIIAEEPADRYRTTQNITRSDRIISPVIDADEHYRTVIVSMRAER